MDVGGYGANAGAKTIDYESLQQKYAGFINPVVQVEIDGKIMEGIDIVINDVTIDLTSGFEASMAEFCLYGLYNTDKGEFDYDKVKKFVDIGNCMVVRLGYASELCDVFVGAVTGMAFAYDGIGLPKIVVTGMDIKAIMMSGRYANQLSAKTYSDAVREVLQKTAYVNMQEAGGIISLKISDTPDKEATGDPNDPAKAPITVELVNESDYEFVTKAAKRFNFEFFSDCGDVFFRKAKSVTDPLISLSAQRGIISFDISYCLTGMVLSVEARGMDAGTGKAISASAKYQGKAGVGSAAKKLISGSKLIYTDASITKKEDAASRAEALLNNTAYRFGELKCEAIGLPDLKVGRFISLEGFGKPADNNFYITNIKHLLNDDIGFKTRLCGCIDGLAKTGIT